MKANQEFVVNTEQRMNATLFLEDPLIADRGHHIHNR